jgi:hypothetical protein
MHRGRVTTRCAEHTGAEDELLNGHAIVDIAKRLIQTVPSDAIHARERENV